MKNTNQVTIYFAQKIAIPGKLGMGGQLNINGAVGIRDRVASINPVFAKLAIARAKRNNPDWVVELVETKADSAWYGVPSKDEVEKAQRQLELLAN